MFRRKKQKEQNGHSGICQELPDQVAMMKTAKGYILYFPEKRLWRDARVTVNLSVSTFKIAATFDSNRDIDKFPDVLEIDRSGI